MTLMMSGVLLFSSCIGSFRLTRNVYEWNQSVGDKFVNELVFLVFSIVPVYEVAVFIDAVVLNSIEFWSGKNPMASNEVRSIETENGRFLVKRTNDGYELTNVEQQTTAALHFDEADQTWSIEANGERIPFMNFIDADHVRLYLPDGTTVETELSEAGVIAFQEAVQVYAPAYALR